MPDMNKEALAIWESLKPAIDKEIEKKTAGMVQRRKMKVSTAPSLSTGLIGVKEPFGDEIFIPFVGNLATATVGKPVWVEFSYGANNYIAIGYASLTDKDVTIAGTLDVTPRRCNANLSSVGWYRIMQSTGYRTGATAEITDIYITRTVNGTNNESHYIRLKKIYNSKVEFADESSFSNVKIIDKIRCTNDDSNSYIDIHYNSTAANNVYVDFDVSGRLELQKSVVSVPFTSVADAPVNETILGEYALNANGTGDINANGTVTGQGFSDLLFGIGTTIASNTDCDSIQTEGKYTCPTSGVGSTLSNAPYTSAFGMLVLRVAESTRLVQIAAPNSNTVTIKIRYFNGTTWTAWKTLTPA